MGCDSIAHVVLLLLLLGPCLCSREESSATQILSSAKKDREWLVSVRRKIHENPELRFEEYNTSALIRGELDKLGISYTHPLAKTGIVAEIGTGSGPELVEWEHKSKIDGKMHGCGHRCPHHYAAGAAKLLSQRKHKLKVVKSSIGFCLMFNSGKNFYYLIGTVRLLFQPAEEGGLGAREMIKVGALGDAEVIFGMHIDHETPTGKPHTNADPILAASFSILALQQLISRELDPLDSQVLSVTTVKGGTTLNLTPSHVVLRGSLRSLTTEGLKQLRKRVKEVIEGQAAVHRCNAYFDRTEDYLLPAVVNDEVMHQHVMRVGKLVLGPENILIANKVMASEDFAFYQEVIPGVMFSIGIRNELVGSVHSPHSPHFFLDEDVLPIGAALHTALAEIYLDEHQNPTLP
ncbi:IAA-amino acid hydrolase ILR1-like 3 [Vitis vinifera]|uniref:IAA-amino acid hydrolase ILR1-like 3 n=1 Tax=Vitis vinifera TaxID=29760 RepID=A0A438E0R9_VITVI|nr:IAA-amino acid hydrolase ILR1-like 3 [Vitis vinifera]